jgi:hypothetical protein
MRRILIGAMIMAAGCNSPVVPARAEEIKPVHHNIPATDAAGTVWYLCETKPRPYNGKLERDHYIQKGECPVTMID